MTETYQDLQNSVNRVCDGDIYNVCAHCRHCIPDEDAVRREKQTLSIGRPRWAYPSAGQVQFAKCAASKHRYYCSTELVHVCKGDKFEEAEPGLDPVSFNAIEIVGGIAAVAAVLVWAVFFFISGTSNAFAWPPQGRASAVLFWLIVTGIGYAIALSILPKGALYIPTVEDRQ